MRGSELGEEGSVKSLRGTHPAVSQDFWKSPGSRDPKRYFHEGDKQGALPHR